MKLRPNIILNLLCCCTLFSVPRLQAFLQTTVVLYPSITIGLVGTTAISTALNFGFLTAQMQAMAEKFATLSIKPIVDIQEKELKDFKKNVLKRSVLAYSIIELASWPISFIGAFYIGATISLVLMTALLIGGSVLRLLQQR